MKNLIIALTFVLGLATVATSQQKLYTLTELNPLDIRGAAIACAKEGGLGAAIYTLDENGDGIPAYAACLKEVKSK